MTAARSEICRPLQSADGAPDTTPQWHPDGHVTSPETPRSDVTNAARTTTRNDDVIFVYEQLLAHGLQAEQNADR